MTISVWPLDEPPRERLLSLGPALLVDAELLAVLLRVGIRAESALDIARDLLTKHRSIFREWPKPWAAFRRRIAASDWPRHAGPRHQERI